MNVLLTGAAGNVGLETLKFLLKFKHNVTVLELNTRKIKNKLKSFKSKITIIYGSINDKDLIKKLIQGKDAVIHLAAIIPPLADFNHKLAKKVNYYGTKNIVDCIKKEIKKPFLIYSSSISVYGDRVKECNISVTDVLNPSLDDYYAKTKIMTENYIRKSGIPYTIFRLTGIMGLPSLDPLMFHMPLDTKIEFATNTDVGRALSTSLNHLEELNHKTFNLGGGEKFRTTYRAFLQNMLNIYGINYKYLKEEAFATQNFHCGYYADTEVLNNILHFQKDTLNSYFNRVSKEVKWYKKIASKLFSRPICYFLNKSSEPLEAKKNKNNSLIKKFFK